LSKALTPQLPISIFHQCTRRKFLFFCIPCKSLSASARCPTTALKVRMQPVEAAKKKLSKQRKIAQQASFGRLCSMHAFYSNKNSRSAATCKRPRQVGHVTRARASAAIATIRAQHSTCKTWRHGRTLTWNGLAERAPVCSALTSQPRNVSKQMGHTASLANNAPPLGVQCSPF
jgi:hypothetical protein